MDPGSYSLRCLLLSLFTYISPYVSFYFIRVVFFYFQGLFLRSNQSTKLSQWVVPFHLHLIALVLAFSKHHSDSLTCLSEHLLPFPCFSIPFPCNRVSFPYTSQLTFLSFEQRNKNLGAGHDLSSHYHTNFIGVLLSFKAQQVLKGVELGKGVAGLQSNSLVSQRNRSEAQPKPWNRLQKTSLSLQQYRLLLILHRNKALFYVSLVTPRSALKTERLPLLSETTTYSNENPTRQIKP